MSINSTPESTFLSVLPKITNQTTPTITNNFNYISPNLGGLYTDPTTGIGATAANYSTAINNFLTQPQNFSRDLQGFFKALYLVTNPGATTIPDAGTGITYQTALSQLNSLTNPADVSVLGVLGIPMGTLTKNALNYFFSQLTSSQLGGNVNNFATQLNTVLSQFLTKTADLGNYGAFPSYYELFVAFTHGTSQADFQGKFSSFYNQTVAQYGYFLPSQMLPQWIGLLTKQTNPTSTLNLGTGSEKTAIIFQLLALVSQMINTLQNVSTAQVQRLTFYANWQKSYSTLISKVPIITYSDLSTRVKSSSSNTGGSNDAVVQAVQQIGNINQTYTQQAQGFQQSVSDESKSQQNAVDQTKEALNSQSSLTTTLLQNMTSILQAIFSGG